MASCGPYLCSRVFALLDVGALRLRMQKRCGLDLNRNLPSLDKNYFYYKCFFFKRKASNEGRQPFAVLSAHLFITLDGGGCNIIMEVSTSYLFSGPRLKGGSGKRSGGDKSGTRHEQHIQTAFGIAIEKAATV